MAIKCGSTGHYHDSVAQVRACQLGTPVSSTNPTPTVQDWKPVADNRRREVSEVGQRLARSAGIPLSEIEEGRGKWAQPESEYASVRTAPSEPIRQATITEPSRTDRSRTGYRPAGPAIRPATEKMVKYVSDLIAQREIPEAIAEVTRSAIKEERLSFQAARLFIESYKDAQRKAPAQGTAAPAAPALPEVPAGRYALRTDGVVKFYQLDRPESGKWAGYTFLKAQASDETYPIKNLTAKSEILGRIAEDIEAAAVLYGTELGRCYRCGRTLTDELSRSLGIGPDCRSK